MTEEIISLPKTISCAPYYLYSGGGLYDSTYECQCLQKLTEDFAHRFEFIEEMFPRAVLSRSEMVDLAGPTPTNYERLRRDFQAINESYKIAAPAVLVKIDRALIWNNMLFIDASERYIPLYECYRQNDRQEKGERIASQIEQHAIVDLDQVDDTPHIFVGSAGSFNYGHWLTDDFPRYIGAQHLLRKYHKVNLVLSKFSDAINSIRYRALEIISKDNSEAKTTFIDPNVPHRVRNIYYVTPVSYHPFVKNPSAMKYLREIEIPQDLTRPPQKQVYVNRYAPWPRLIVNNEQVLSFMENMGFHEVVPERNTLDEQISYFRNADLIIGIMGAGMANIVFSAPTARITFMAPDGWAEPYFWDLASMCGQRYKSLFSVGHEDGHHLYQRSFEMDPEIIMKAIMSDIGWIESLLMITKSRKLITMIRSITDS